jgi:NADH-quinone oxidoreductase subunit N
MAAISVYYYFRLIQAMYFRDGSGQLLNISTGFRFMMVILATITVLLGIFPSILTNWLYF